MSHGFREWARLHRRRLQVCVWFLVTLPVVAFYWWTATSSNGPFKWRNGQVDHYNLLADGFLKGHLYMALEPMPEMLALPNPYDPVANLAFRKHDASLYQGRYYLYFGPVPALTLFVPWKILFGASPPPGFVVVFFVTLGYVFSCLLLWRLLRAARAELPLALFGVVFAALGLGQFTLILLRRAEVYEVAIAAGFCFLMAGLYFLALRIFDDAVRLGTSLAGIFLGLSPGCRPHLAVAVVAMASLYGLFLWRRRRLRGGALCSEMLRLCAPIAVCGLCLAWYNYARFGRPLEFGQQYQLTSRVETVGQELTLPHVLPDLKTLLFLPPVKLQGFPFFQLRVASRQEPTVGLVEVMPLCFVACLLAPFLIGRERWMGPRASWIAVALFATAALTLFFLCLTGNSNLRYQVDYTGVLWVATLFLLLVAARHAPHAWMRSGLTALIVAGCLWSVAATALLSVNGYEGGLEQKNWPVFHQLASWFGG